MGSIFFHPMCLLRDMQNLLMDLVDDVPEVYRLRDMVVDYSARQLVFQMAEVAVPKELFAQILHRIGALAPAPG